MSLPSSDKRPLCEHESEEHTSELQSQSNLVCRLLLEKKKKNICLHGYAAIKILSATFYALIYSKTTVSVALVSLVLYFVGNYVLLRWMSRYVSTAETP